MLEMISHVYSCGVPERRRCWLSLAAMVGSVIAGPMITGTAVVGAAAFLLASTAPEAFAQDDEEEVEVDEEEVATITTADGVKLKASYYAGADYNSAPIVILHDFEEDRSKYQELGEFLQAEGHTVLLPDLRGHGQSTATTKVDNRGRPITITTKGMNRAHIARMITDDMEAIKGFLIERNDKKELNIRKMCIIGAGMGAVVALNYAANDWSYEDRGLQRQGKDVRGLVLLSPPTVFKGMPIRKALASISKKGGISVLTLVGGKSKNEAKLADQIHKMLSVDKARKLPKDPAERKKKKSLFLKKFDTNLQGGKLLGNEELGAESLILGFINRRISEQTGDDMKWKKRD